MQTPPPLSFDSVFMDNAQCAEMNGKSIFRFLLFLFSELSEKFIENWDDFSKIILQKIENFRVMVIFVLKPSKFSINFHDNSKNEN